MAVVIFDAKPQEKKKTHNKHKTKEKIYKVSLVVSLLLNIGLLWINIVN